MELYYIYLQIHSVFLNFRTLREESESQLFAQGLSTKPMTEHEILDVVWPALRTALASLLQTIFLVMQPSSGEDQILLLI